MLSKKVAMKRFVCLGMAALCCALICCPLICCACSAQAEVRRGGKGKVQAGLCVAAMDESGHAIALAQVEIVGDGSAAQAQTRSNGECARFELQPGRYSVTVTAAGYSANSEKNILVRKNVLTPVVVPLVANERVALLAGVEAEHLAGQELPVESRDVEGYLPLTATVNLVPDVGRNPEQDTGEWLSVRGLAQTTGGLQLDGMNYSRALDGNGRGSGQAAAGALGFSSEAVREFAWNGGSYSARSGAMPGAVVNALQRRSVLDAGPVHGKLFLFARSNVLDAMNPYSLATSYNATTETVSESVVKPEDLRLQWGAAMEGELRHGRADWSLVYDQMYRNFPLVSAPSSATFFSLTTSQVAVLANRGVTAQQTAKAMQYLAGETGESPREQKQWNVMPRLGWQWGERERFSVEGNVLRTNGPASGMGSPVVSRAADSIGTSTLGIESGAMRWVHFVTENAANEFRGAYSHELVQEFAAVNAGPQVTMGVGGLTLGTASYLPRSAYPEEFAMQLADTLTWVHGKHTVSAGGEWTRSEEKINQLRYSNGAYSYNSIVDWISDFTYNHQTYMSGTAAADGVCNGSGGPAPPGTTTHYECFSRYTQGFGAQRLEFDTRDMAGYAEDAWKVHPRLSVTAGVRYEYEQLPSPQLPNATLDAAFVGSGSTSVYAETRNNAGPRVGVAWDAFGRGRGTVRAGYGVFFGRVLDNTLETALQNTGLPTCDGSTAEHCQLGVSATVIDTLGGYPNIFPNYAATAGIAPSKYNRSVLMGAHFHTPVIQQGELNVEHELGRWMTLSGTYLVSLSRELPNMVDVNIAAAPSTGTFVLQGAPPNGAKGTYSGENFVVPYYQTRVNSNYGPVSALVSNINGYYDAMVVEATRQLRHGIGFDAHWTWSKAVDYGQTVGGLGVATGASNDNQFDPYAIGYDRGLSSFNVPHKLVVAIDAEPRWRVEGHRVRNLVNGWQWTPLLVEQSGYAYSYNVYGGTSLSGGHQSMNRSGGAEYLPTVGRNTLRLPDTYNLNLRLTRHFEVREKMRVDLMAESYNLLNHQNQTGMVTTAYAAQTVSNGQVPLVFQDSTQTSTPFGQYIASATGRYAERQIELAVRLHF